MKTSERLLEAVLRNVYMFFVSTLLIFILYVVFPHPGLVWYFFASLGFVIGLAGAYFLVDSYEA